MPESVFVFTANPLATNTGVVACGLGQRGVRVSFFVFCFGVEFVCCHPQVVGSTPG